MIIPSLINVYYKLGEMSDITDEEIKNAVKNLNVPQEFFIYIILFQFFTHRINLKTDVSYDNRLDYYTTLVTKIVNLFPEVYDKNDIELYSKFTMASYMYSFNINIENKELNLLIDIFNILDNQIIENKTLKWLIKEITKNYLLKYYLTNKNYHELMKPLIEELLVNENEFYDLLKDLVIIL